ncbi:hypothetical protein NR798_44640 [Archangium gephyra]|uniref:hypothetical protein n=1 Tax=Archangium gephyra TaxID=48 RepID=UPI0035D47DF2
MTQTSETSSQGVTARLIHANHFVLRTRDIQVSFLGTSLTGEPLFYYKDRTRAVSARGRELHLHDTELGTLVTLTLTQGSDGEASLYFTLVLPRVDILQGSEAPVSTVGIYTRSHEHPRPHPFGDQLQTYNLVWLRGQAGFIIS